MSLLKIRRKGEEKKRHDGDDAILPLAKDELGVSDAAAMRINELVAAKNGESLYLRVAIRGGGCSGLSIHYEFSSEKRSNDMIFTHNKAQVIIDKKSLSILGGATLHCRDYLGSKEFYLVNNPAAKQCSCGQSFAL
ncbi:MAG TPA: iron-sulfur cluster assembly accessory protein [Myxococcota bacterium]|nr:iron-sulfur cluster assembly accessory protein [Myxococcota bacterium]